MKKALILLAAVVAVGVGFSLASSPLFAAAGDSVYGGGHALETS